MKRSDAKKRSIHPFTDPIPELSRLLSGTSCEKGPLESSDGKADIEGKTDFIDEPGSTNHICRRSQ